MAPFLKKVVTHWDQMVENAPLHSLTRLSPLVLSTWCELTLAGTHWTVRTSDSFYVSPYGTRELTLLFSCRRAFPTTILPHYSEPAALWSVLIPKKLRREYPHITRHLFACRAHPTDLEVQDLRRNPVDTCQFLATLPCFVTCNRWPDHLPSHLQHQRRGAVETGEAASYNYY